MKLDEGISDVNQTNVDIKGRLLKLIRNFILFRLSYVLCLVRTNKVVWFVFIQ